MIDPNNINPEELMKMFRRMLLIGLVVTLGISALIGGALRSGVTARSTVVLHQPVKTSAFKADFKANHWLGFFGEEEINLNRYLTDKNGWENVNVTSLKVTHKVDWVNSLCGICTFFIYTPSRIEVEGTAEYN